MPVPKAGERDCRLEGWSAQTVSCPGYTMGTHPFPTRVALRAEPLLVNPLNPQGVVFAAVHRVTGDKVAIKRTHIGQVDTAKPRTREPLHPENPDP